MWSGLNQPESQRKKRIETLLWCVWWHMHTRWKFFLLFVMKVLASVSLVMNRTSLNSIYIRCNDFAKTFNAPKTCMHSKNVIEKRTKDCISRFKARAQDVIRSINCKVFLIQLKSTNLCRADAKASISLISWSASHWKFCQVETMEPTTKFCMSNTTQHNACVCVCARMCVWMWNNLDVTVSPYRQL